MKISDEAVAEVALALADEVRTWPDNSSLPYNSAVGVGRTFHLLAHTALQAATPFLAPAVPQPVDREALADAITAHGIAWTRTDSTVACTCDPAVEDKRLPIQWRTYAEFSAHQAAALAGLALAGEQEQAQPQ